MALDSRIVGSQSGQGADVDASYNLKVALTQVPSKSGYERPLGEVDAGLVTGAAYLLATETSEDYRVRAELDTIFDSHVFNETAQYSGKHYYNNATMTNTWSGNALNTNGSGITTINTATYLHTYQYFPVFGGAETYAYFTVGFTGTWAVTNTTIDIGLFHNLTLSAPFAPIDGVYIRANNTGLFGVSCFNGTEQTTSVFKVSSGGASWTPTIGTFYDVIVTTTQNLAVFWMDLRDGNGFVRMGSIIDPVGTGLPASVQALPFSIRHSIGGTVASGVMGAKVSTYTVTQGGYQNTRSDLIASAIYSGGQQGQAGHTQGSTALYTNSLAPTAGAVMTNTTAALGTGMGGQFSALPTLAANTDGIVCSYQNPLPTSAIPGRTLVIHGIHIESMVTTVLVGNATPVVYAYSLCYGGGALSLAQAESATVKAARRMPVGFQQFAAAAPLYTTATPLDIKFTRPLPVNPGEFVQVAAKNIGVVTTTGVVTFFIYLDWGWVL